MPRQSETRLGPVLLALGLAILSIPIVAGALMNTGAPGYYELPDPAFGDVLVLAAVACLASAGLAGVIGGAVLRQHRVLGPLVAIGLAWPIAVTLVPLVANALGIHYQAVVFCLDSCSVEIDSAKPFSGIAAVAGTIQMGVMTIVPDIILLAALWAADRAARGGSNGAAAALVVLGFGALDWPAFACGGATGLLPFAILAIGVTLWASMLKVRATAQSPAQVRPGVPLPGRL
jgi:hypothetical protein